MKIQKNNVPNQKLKNIKRMNTYCLIPDLVKTISYVEKGGFIARYTFHFYDSRIGINVTNIGTAVSIVL